MSTISTIIITHNEASNIRRCLESVKWSDEIIVLDSGSTDNTVEICREYTPKVTVTVTDWPGYGPQKNRALKQASCDWVLSIDADEHLSPALQTDIQHAMTHDQHTAYSMPRQSTYCGRLIRYGAWHNDRVCRLFKRGTAQFKDAPVHESLIVDGSIGQLHTPLLHHSFQDLEAVLHKVNHYSTLGAKQRLQQGRKGSLGIALAHSCWEFVRSYLLKRGFLDGREGFILAVSNAEGTFYQYLKLYYLRKNSTKKLDKHK